MVLHKIRKDISNLDDLDRLFAIVRAEKEHMDVLFANAGIGGRSPLGASSEEQFDKVFERRLFAPRCNGLTHKILVLPGGMADQRGQRSDIGLARN